MAGIVLACPSMPRTYRFAAASPSIRPFPPSARNVPLDRQPHLIETDAEVMVDQLVAGPGNILPRNIGILFAKGGRKMLHGLADDFKLTDDAVLNQV